MLDEEVPLQRCSAFLAEPDEPQSYKQLMMSENAEHWKEAMKEEYNSLMKNQTWILAKLPPGRIALNQKWIGKYKPAHPGVEERWKTRLIVFGTRQQYVRLFCVQLIYYNSRAVELTVRPSGVRLILRLTADAAT